MQPRVSASCPRSSRDVVYGIVSTMRSFLIKLVASEMNDLGPGRTWPVIGRFRMGGLLDSAYFRRLIVGNSEIRTN